MSKVTDHAFFGLGAMGFPIARHLATRIKLSVHDPSAPRMQKLQAATPPDAITIGKVQTETARTVFLCLPDQTTVEQVIGQLLDTGATERRIIDFGAHPPQFVTEMATRCRSADVQYCDAPVFGTPGMAERGELYFLFSGEAQIAAEFEQLAGESKYRVRYAGPAGTASAIKLLQNALGTVNLAIGAEAMQICDGVGIDKQVFIDVVRECGGIGFSRVFDRFGEDMANRNDSGEGRMRIAAKDMQSAAWIARSCNIAAPILAMTAAKFAKAIESGLGEHQFTSIIELPEVDSIEPQKSSD